jgi:Mn2+/Fe2+ NRAMP family transporter
MGALVNPAWLTAAAWAISFAIIGLNLKLLYGLL